MPLSLSLRELSRHIHCVWHVACARCLRRSSRRAIGARVRYVVSSFLLVLLLKPVLGFLPLLLLMLELVFFILGLLLLQLRLLLLVLPVGGARDRLILLQLMLGFLLLQGITLLMLPALAVVTAESPSRKPEQRPQQQDQPVD